MPVWCIDDVHDLVPVDVDHIPEPFRLPPLLEAAGAEHVGNGWRVPVSGLRHVRGCPTLYRHTATTQDDVDRRYKRDNPETRIASDGTIERLGGLSGTLPCPDCFRWQSPSDRRILAAAANTSRERLAALAQDAADRARSRTGTGSGSSFREPTVGESLEVLEGEGGSFVRIPVRDFGASGLPVAPHLFANHGDEHVDVLISPALRRLLTLNRLGATNPEIAGASHLAASRSRRDQQSLWDVDLAIVRGATPTPTGVRAWRLENGVPRPPAEWPKGWQVDVVIVDLARSIALAREKTPGPTVEVQRDADGQQRRNVEFAFKEIEGYEYWSEGRVVQARRSEHALVARFMSFLEASGRSHSIQRARTSSGAEIEYDLFDESLVILFEAKADGGDRSQIRMAIGQLRGYGYHFFAKLGTPVRQAVLVPNRPPQDVCEVLGYEGIGVAWESDPGTFVEEYPWD